MKYAAYTRTVVLGAGVVSAWSALTVQLVNFYIGATGATNPYITPCLYGSLAFLVALVWSSMLIVHPNPRGEVWLQRLLIFGIIFAALVTAYDCADYLGLIHLGVPIVCSPGVNPIFGACFRGLIFFIAAYAAGVWQTRSDNSENPGF